MTDLSVATPASIETRDSAQTRTAISEAVPWYIWCSVAAVTSVMIGGYWDISWHMSIGRDTFWTPAHMAIYLCGVLAGTSCGYLILATTFGSEQRAREGSVRVWGFHAPLGAFICAWGGVTMLASAPFDNWWHNAYGLDVKIFSPPHLVLDAGILAVQFGGLLLIAGAMNRAEGEVRRKLRWLFIYVSAMILTLGLTIIWEYDYRVFMHSASCYRAVAFVAPVLLLGGPRASGYRYGTAMLAAIYSIYMMLMLWIFPLFPAEPKLGPVYHPVTHFVPMEFPLLIIVPAVQLDLLFPRIAAWNKWSQAVVAGSVFLVAFLAVQWPFADFLLAPASRNWFFGTDYLPYFDGPNSYSARHLFVPFDRTAFEFWSRMVEALLITILSTRIGIGWGNWMRRVQR
jgi:hypothetical protein